MNAFLIFLTNGMETATAAATAAALELNQTAFMAYGIASEAASTFDWQPYKEVLDNHWGRLAQMNPILYLYPLTILFWAFLVYMNAPRYNREEDFGEMKITIYTRGRPHRQWRSPSPPKSGHKMVRRSMRGTQFYELE